MPTNKNLCTLSEEIDALMQDAIESGQSLVAFLLQITSLKVTTQIEKLSGSNAASLLLACGIRMTRTRRQRCLLAGHRLLCGPHAVRCNAAVIARHQHCPFLQWHEQRTVEARPNVAWTGGGHLACGRR